MKKPVFPHCNTIYTISWILTLPILIDICTACSLFSFWLVWILYFAVAFISCIRLYFGFRQKCYKFCWALIGELVIGCGILLFFQLSFNDQIKNALNHSVAPDVVQISDPVLHKDSIENNKALIRINDLDKQTETESGHR